MKQQLEPFVVDVLSRSTLKGQVLVLPEQLDRAEYVAVDKALRALGGKWDRKAGGHTFPFDPSELLGTAVDEGAVVNRQKELQFFETPEGLANRMVDFVDLPSCKTALEPSAGHGRIARLLARPNVKVTAVEIDETNARVLSENVPQATVLQADFLEWASGTQDRFDAIVMNPPFTRFQDVAHIRQAHQLLAPGGTLVAICSESPFFRTEAVAEDFRAWLADNDATVENLGTGAFSSSGAGVATRLVVLGNHSTSEGGES